MNNIHLISFTQFLLVYILLLVVIAVMKKNRINQTKLLVLSSIRMTIQLIIAGFVLSFIIKKPKPLFTFLYLTLMAFFTVFRVLNKNKGLNKSFKLCIFFSIITFSVFVIFYFVKVVVKENLSNAQYSIPIAGMIFGNTMTALNLGLNTFSKSFSGQKAKITALMNAGGSAKTIMLPFISHS